MISCVCNEDCIFVFFLRFLSLENVILVFSLWKCFIIYSGYDYL